ncbi:NAD-P-binding protein [Amylostereum chailletii]|nr:NAD-P-binding protein [Amylostereum chailletii]
MGLFFSHPPYVPERDIPGLDGRVTVVTGADSGIGFHTVEQLAAHGAKVYLLCITLENAQDAISRIELNLPRLRGTKCLVPVQIDLSSLASVREAARTILAEEKRLDILINNAGRLASDYVQADSGVEMSVAVNHIGPFVLTTMLLPLLKSTASLPGSDVRIISLTSYAYKLAGPVRFTTLDDLNDPRGAPGARNGWLAKFRRYGATKLMIILFIGELQRQLDAENIPITAMAVHPGEIATPAAITNTPLVIRPYIWIAALSPYQGSFTTLFAATSRRIYEARDQFKGCYLVPYGEIEKLTTPQSQDEQLARTLWETTERVVKTLDGIAG